MGRSARKHVPAIDVSFRDADQDWHLELNGPNENVSQATTRCFHLSELVEDQQGRPLTFNLCGKITQRISQYALIEPAAAGVGSPVLRDVPPTPGSCVQKLHVTAGRLSPRRLDLQQTGNMQAAPRRQRQNVAQKNIGIGPGAIDECGQRCRECQCEHT